MEMFRRSTCHVLALAIAGVSCGEQGAADTAAPTIASPAPAGAAAPAPGAAPAQPSVQPSASAAVAAPASTTAAASGSPAASAPAAAAPSSTPAAMPSTGEAPASTANLPAPGVDPISAECRGFDFNGLVYSPGGVVLPNKCAAFHPTLNNPYAVRCVDAWPWFKTQYAGDQYCVLPPAPDKGIQFGHHPQGEFDAWFQAVSKGDMSAYENPGEGWTLEPGAEEERNIYIQHKNPAGKYQRVNNRMRGGSHHMIVSASEVAPGQTNTWILGSPEGLFTGTGVPGAQRPDENTPQSEMIPAEDVGLYREVIANATITYNMHHFNPSDKAIMKEAWQNLWWAENPQTPVNGVNGLPILQAVGTFANPGEIVDMHYGYTVPGNMRILGLFGHRHAWTTNFSAWVVRGGKEEVIYQSFDWFDEPTFQYNSEVKNATPDVATRSDGAHTGILELKAGDQLHFNCHIEYTDQRAMEENSPITPAQNGPLRFANEAFTAEMCILFGSAVGQGGDMQQMGPPPAFAKAR
jgi:hypothetical protein